jgi:N-carbamoylputrescine amidase
MKVTVCQLRHEAAEFRQDWEGLKQHAQAENSEFVLLPEMPFYPWFAWKKTFDPKTWEEAVVVHRDWRRRLPELGAALVCGTSPVNQSGKRLNQGFVWDPIQGYIPSHAKYYLPDEEGFWEATWYERGDPDFVIHETPQVKLGFAICTELWFFQHARAYGRAGAHMVICPRATPHETLDKWLVGGRASAVVSGAFSLSSNRISPPEDEADLGGQGWIVDPEGNVLGITSQTEPFITRDLDLSLAEASKRSYPRYVLE